LRSLWSKAATDTILGRDRTLGWCRIVYEPRSRREAGGGRDANGGYLHCVRPPSLGSIRAVPRFTRPLAVGQQHVRHPVVLHSSIKVWNRRVVSVVEALMP